MRILTRLSKQVFWNWNGLECRVYYAKRKSKRFLLWSSGQDLLAVVKPTPLLPHAKILLVSVWFFFWRVDYALEGSMCWLSKCDFSRLFHTERSWHGYWFSVVFVFLVSMICLLMQQRFFIFFFTSFEAWSSFLWLNKAVRFLIFVQSASGSE